MCIPRGAHIDLQEEHLRRKGWLVRFGLVRSYCSTPLKSKDYILTGWSKRGSLSVPLKTILFVVFDSQG